MNSTARNTEKNLLLPNTVSQKDEKAHTAGLNDTAIPYFKIKITEIPLERKKNNKTQKTNKQKQQQQLDTVILPYSCFIWLKGSITLIRAETES